MTETRLGRQTPTQSVTIPYSKTRGQEAAELYAKTGNELLEWQQLLQCDIMAVNDDGLWMHQKYGYSVPRRNGKSENVLRAAYGELKNGRKNSIHGTQSNNITRSVGRLDRMCEKQESRYHHHLRRSEKNTYTQVMEVWWNSEQEHHRADLAKGTTC